MRINKDQYFGHIKGYKISDAHFELGSNLHITEYFYAKRVFYNSFYTNRFAFLVARFILREIGPGLQDYLRQAKAQQGPWFTLLGYENYSELLISNVRKMLNDFIACRYKPGVELFNHDIYTKEGFFLKNPAKIGREMISIFPISTTFSTSIKIQNEILELFKARRFAKHQPVFRKLVVNCVVIAGRSLDHTIRFDPPDIEAEFGWQTLDPQRKSVMVLEYDRAYAEGAYIETPGEDDFTVEQKYFIALRTPWSKINRCAACYPASPALEKCLIETKQSPVTPNLIFGYPRASSQSVGLNIYPVFKIRGTKLRPEPLVYRKHFKRFDKHFIYFLRTGRFLQENKVDIVKWLDELRNTRFSDDVDKNIVIITPTTGSNSGFVNLFNDVVFSDTATIIQFNPKEEFIQNFKLFYTDTIGNAERVLFADDVLASTDTFSEINFFVQNLRKNNQGFNGCVCLINRVGYFNFIKLQNKFNRLDSHHLNQHIISFTKTHVSPLMHRNKYPYDELMEKFHDLAEKSVLDSMKIHFMNLERDFKPIDLNREFKKFEKEGSPKSLFQFLFLHEFMDMFRAEGPDNVYTHQQTISEIFENGKQDSYKALLHYFEANAHSNSVMSFIKDYPEFAFELNNALFKLCSSDPYIRFRPIKAASFNWVLGELSALVAEITKNGGVGETFFQASQNCLPTIYSPYEHFRFLLKRAAKLKMNYIYSPPVLEAVGIVLAGISKFRAIQRFDTATDDLFPMEAVSAKLTPAKREPVYVIAFINYYVGLLQELIFDHESKALQVVVYIKQIIDGNLSRDPAGKTLKNTYNDSFLHMLRILVLENTFIFHTVSDKFLLKMNPNVFFGNTDYTDFEHKINYFRETYAFSYTEKMLSRFRTSEDGEIVYDEQPDVFASFKHMLLLKALLKSDKQEEKGAADVSIKDKAEDILRICCDILDIQRGGAYMAVKYKNKRKPATDDDIAYIGEYHRNVRMPLRPQDYTEESLLFKVFDGLTEYNSDKPTSVYEITLDDNLNYRFRFNEQINNSQFSNFAETRRPRYRNIFFLRITDIEFSEDANSYEAHPLAVICLYKNELSPEENSLMEQNMVQLPGVGDVTHPISILAPGCSPPDNGYERFDPKKIRQLMLLRDDVGGFLRAHLNNDSLRSYIEMINNENYQLTLSHGMKVYENLVAVYLEKTAVAVGLIETRNELRYLNVAFVYLINKLHLLTVAGNEWVNNDLFPNPDMKRYTIGQLADEFVSDGHYLLTMKQLNMGCVKDWNFIEIDASAITDSQRAVSFFLYKGIFREIIFEILYNIKKHVVNENASHINEQNKLKIDLMVLNVHNTYWFSVSNNFSNKDSLLLTRLNDYIMKKQNTHGLNLIYHIIYKLTGKQIVVSSKDDVFSIYIPLKLIGNED